MGRYKRIVKKKNGDSALDSPSQSLWDFLSENIEKIGAAAGAVVLLAAMAYGVSYYYDSRAADAQNKLYEASKSIPTEKATTTQADEAISAYKGVIEKGGPDEIIVQARLNLATAYTRKGDLAAAADEYGKAAEKAGKGSFLHEVALAGAGNTLMSLGKMDEAATKFKELYDTAKNYPKQDALFGQALALAASGKKDEATTALNKLKSEFPNYLSGDFVSDTLRRVENGELAALAKTVAAAPAAPATQPQQAAPSPIGKTDVHAPK